MFGAGIIVNPVADGAGIIGDFSVDVVPASLGLLAAGVALLGAARRRG